MLFQTTASLDSMFIAYNVLCVLNLIIVLGGIVTLMTDVKRVFFRILATAIASVLILITITDIALPLLKEKEVVAITPIKSKTLYLDDYTLVKNNDKYFIISRQTGMVSDIDADNYMRYELCYQIELVEYEYIKKVKGMLVSVEASGVGYRIDCFSE